MGNSWKHFLGKFLSIFDSGLVKCFDFAGCFFLVQWQSTQVVLVLGEILVKVCMHCTCDCMLRTSVIYTLYIIKFYSLVNSEFYCLTFFHELVTYLLIPRTLPLLSSPDIPFKGPTSVNRTNLN